MGSACQSAIRACDEQEGMCAVGIQGLVSLVNIELALPLVQI